MDPSSAMCSNFLLEIWNGPQLSDFKGFLLRKWDNNVLSPSDGGLVRQKLNVCHSVHMMGPGWGDVLMWVCAWLGGRQGAQRCRN